MAEPKEVRYLDGAIDFWKKLHEGEVHIKFTKKDGSIRYMVCTLDFSKIPKKDHPKKVNMAKIASTLKNSGIIHVYDLENRGWRSVPVDRVHFLDFEGVRYKIKK